jgi:hypothetical protein
MPTHSLAHHRICFMSDAVLTMVEEERAQDYFQDLRPFSPSAPTIGRGIAVLCLGIVIGQQLSRQ